MTRRVVYDNLKALGLTVPPPTLPVAAFVPWVECGDLLFISGHIAKQNGAPWIGQLGNTLSTDDGKKAARGVALDLLATLNAATRGELHRIHRIVKLMVLVNSAAEFTEQHLVANGASELFQEIFGSDIGAHSRSAFGVAQLPFGSCVEIDLIAQLDHDGSLAS